MRQRISPRFSPSVSGGPQPYFRTGTTNRHRSIANGDDDDNGASKSIRKLHDRVAVQWDDRDDNDSGGIPIDWTEEEIVFLHWRLLQDLRHLANPATPLGEKLSTLRWVLTEPEKDTLPFSFVNCLRVVGCSPLSPIAYCGRVDSETIRKHIASNARRWLTESLTSYPDWVAHALADNPAWVDAQLERNPQWINEQVRQVDAQGDLFG